MKCLIYSRDDGGVSVGHISQTVLAAMTGAGGLIRADRVDREIDKFVNPPSPETGISVSVATVYVNGLATGGMTETAAIEAIRAKDQPVGSSACYIKEDTDIPADRTFRDAWEAPSGTVGVNMPKARVIHMGRIRVARNAELAVLDVSYLKATEAGDTAAQTAIAAEKQTLRDIPATYDLSVHSTPENLKAAIPTELADRM